MRKKPLEDLESAIVALAETAEPLARWVGYQIADGMMVVGEQELNELIAEANIAFREPEEKQISL